MSDYLLSICFNKEVAKFSFKKEIVFFFHKDFGTKFRKYFRTKLVRAWSPLRRMHVTATSRIPMQYAPYHPLVLHAVGLTLNLDVVRSVHK